MFEYNDTPESSLKNSNFTKIAYDPHAYNDDEYNYSDRPSWRKHPRSWSKRCWILVAVVAIIVLIIAIVVPVEVTKANRYPDYSFLNYSLADTYAGEGFFDNFNYFYGYDPAQGFVQYDLNISSN